MRILIAEDSPVSRTLLQANLRNWGHEVVAVTNGTDAFALLQPEDAPMLAILDVEMPGMDGTEVCRRLRQMSRPTPTYIILLTANAEKADTVSGLEAGADDYVTKPFDPDELRARVQVGVRIAELQGNLAQHIEVLQETSGRLERNSATLTELNNRMLEEIADRTRAEEELRLQKTLLESQSEASLDGVLVVSQEGEILSLNRNFSEIWDIPEAALMTRDGAAAIRAIADKLDHPDEFLDLADHHRQHLERKSDKDLSLIDGRIVHCYSAPVNSSDGVHYGRVFYFRDITERKRSEAEQARLTIRIESQRQRLDSIITTVPGLVWEAWRHPDPAKQRIDFVSNFVETMLGYSIAEWLATPNFWLSIVHPDDRAQAQEAAANFATRTNCATEFRWIAKDGHVIWVETHFVVIRDDEGQPICLRGVTTDINERKHAEGLEIRRAAQLALRSDINSALAESNTTLRGILERCTEAIVQHLDAAFARVWTLNADHDVLELQASAGLYTHIDGPHARVPVGAFKIGLIAKERLPHITNEVQNDSRVGDHEWARREGMIAFAGYPLIVEDRLVGVIAMFARQKLAADTLDALASIADFVAHGIEHKRGQEELRESAERYRLLFENNPHPMWVYDLETLSFSAVNEAASAHYGYSREEFLAMTVKDIRPPEDVPGLLETLSKSNGSVNGVVNEAGIWRHRKKDGSIIDVEITSHEFLWAGRRAELVLANDITDRRKLEVQLRHAQKLESIGHLAAGIAHEINTPTQFVGDNLRFIEDSYQGLNQVMQKYGELYEAVKAGSISAELLAEVSSAISAADLEYIDVETPKALKQSLEGVERIAKIVQSMKDFAHPDSSEKKAADLNRAIESTINVARGEWKYIAEMETDFDPSLPLVPCLLGELNQLTLNMIINAAHAIAGKMTAEDQTPGLIKISTRHEEGWAEIRISDTGTGIPLAIRARVFDPFFTTKEVGKGTGQGLAISHAVVEKHGGTITFETAEGEGTTFIIRLPLPIVAATPDGLKEAA